MKIKNDKMMGMEFSKRRTKKNNRKIEILWN